MRRRTRRRFRQCIRVLICARAGSTRAVPGFGPGCEFFLSCRCRQGRRRNEELFTNLLFAIAKDVRYKFDRVQLKKGVYSPQAHGDFELEQNLIRKLTLKLLSGENPLKMAVASFAADENAIKTQFAANQALTDALAGKGNLNVTIKHGTPAAPGGNTPPAAN